MRLLVFISFVLFLHSCTESIESPKDLVANNKEKAQRQFDQFYMCYELALTAPPLIKDEINWETQDVNVELGQSNVFQIGLESFKDLSEPLDVQYDGTRRREHADMAQMFNLDLSAHKKAHDYPVDWKYSYFEITDESGSCSQAIKDFLNVKYLLINRIALDSPPYLISEDTYAEGVVKGDVLVFDIEQVKLLGGYLIETKNKDQVKIGEYADIMDNLRADLEHRTYRQTVEKFVDLTPTVSDAGFEF